MKVYLDTNMFYYFFFDEPKYSAGVRKILEKVKKGGYSAYTSCFTLEEFAYVALLSLIENKYKQHPSDVLRKNRAVISEFAKQIQEMFAAIYSFNNIEITNSDKNQVWHIPQVMEENLLLPRDSIHLQTMKGLGIDYILSTDSDFDGIKGIKRLNPEQI